MKKQFAQSWNKNARWKFAKSVKNPYASEQIIQKAKEIAWNWTLLI